MREVKKWGLSGPTSYHWNQFHITTSDQQMLPRAKCVQGPQRLMQQNTFLKVPHNQFLDQSKGRMLPRAATVDATKKDAILKRKSRSRKCKRANHINTPGRQKLPKAAAVLRLNNSRDLLHNSNQLHKTTSGQQMHLRAAMAGATDCACRGIYRHKLCMLMTRPSIEDAV